MKKRIILPLLSLLHVLPISSMEPYFAEASKGKQGPMDSVWFYDKNHAFAKANQLHQKQDWKEATKEYISCLYAIGWGNKMAKAFNLHHQIYGPSEYDNNQAYLNLAICLMAQRKASELWASFDALLNIPLSHRISSDIIQDALKTTEKKSILIRTDQIGIGDIFCFLSAAQTLKENTNWNMTISVPQFLKKTLAGVATAYDCEIIGTEDKCPVTDYETHLISLLGYLKLTPSQMNPQKVVFTAPEKIMNIILEQITPLLEQGNILVIADRGEVGRSANPALIGGKQLPRNSNDHGRHLNSEPFNALLNNHPTITLLDCSKKKDQIIIDNTLKNRYLTLPQEQQPFDNIIALGRIMSAQKNIIAFGPDMGQTNVFMRSLDHEAQNRMAFIIPNPKEHDMRMEGEGSRYKHMISNCWVYKCATVNDQTNVIEQAYNDMLKY